MTVISIFVQLRRQFTNRKPYIHGLLKVLGAVTIEIQQRLAEESRLAQIDLDLCRFWPSTGKQQRPYSLDLPTLKLFNSLQKSNRTSKEQYFNTSRKSQRNQQKKKKKKDRQIRSSRNAFINGNDMSYILGFQKQTIPKEIKLNVLKLALYRKKSSGNLLIKSRMIKIRQYLLYYCRKKIMLSPIKQGKPTKDFSMIDHIPGKITWQKNVKKISIMLIYLS